MVLIKEICSTLRGAYVNNIYTLGEAQLFRFRRQGADDAWLVVAPKLGVWISRKVAERGETSDFTSKIRRDLERARFGGASQADLDRVFELTFGDGEFARKVIVEMMPPGNIILTDGSGRILQLKEEVRSKSRRLVRGGYYSAPSQRRLSPLSVTPEGVADMARAEETAGGAIGRHVALPRKYVTEALSRLNLSEDAPSSALIGKEEAVAMVMREMIREAETNPTPRVCETTGGDQVFVLAPRGLRTKAEYETLSTLCDELLLEAVVEGAASIDDPRDKERRELEGTLSKLRSQEADLRSQGSRFRALAAEAAGSSSAAEAGKIVSEAGMMPRTVPTSQAAAASLLYDKAKELEERASQARSAAIRLSKRIPKMTAPHGNKQTRQLARRKTEWYEKFRWFLTSEGRLALGGRDAHSNALLIRRHLEQDDTVFHADLFGSPFFLIKGGKAQTDSEIREVAQATVAFSSAWKTGLGSADAYWVNPEQVSSAAPSGEYLPRGSYAIRGKKNFVNRNLVEIAVGLDGEGKIVSGPESALARRVRHYLVLKPQREKASETAKRVLRDLTLVSEEVARPSLSLDDVVRALPSGGGKIVRKVSSKEGPTVSLRSGSDGDGGPSTEGRKGHGC